LSWITVIWFDFWFALVLFDLLWIDFHCIWLYFYLIWFYLYLIKYCIYFLFDFDFIWFVIAFMLL